MSTEQRPLKVFLSYASQDRPAVQEIYNALKLEGWIDPWLDQDDILPGQNWDMAIETAVDETDVVLLFLSNQSVSKEGYIQSEIKYVDEVALQKPDGTIFVIPVRLEDCEIPRKLRFLQWVDYFGAEKKDAYSELLDALRVRHEQKLKIETDSQARHAREGSDKAPSLLESEPAQRPPRQKTAPDQRGRRKRGRKGMDSTIIAALISAAVAIIAALIPLFANRFATPPISTPTTTVIVAFTPTYTAVITQTATPITPTLTPVPATNIPTATPTGVPPVLLGEDWIEGCISILWQPYPAEIPVTERGDGCWNEPVYVFKAENGDLDFVAQGRNEQHEIYGLFARLPEKGTVTVTIRLSELTNVDLWIGVFAEPNITSQSLLMTIPAGNATKRDVVHKDPITNEIITRSALLDQGKGFSLTLTFNANSARSIVNPSVFFTESVSIPSSQKWLFLGYKSLLGYYRIEGRFLEFELE